MALIVDWATGLITCPLSELTLVSPNRYQITVDRLWELLRDRSDEEDALAYPVLYTNIPPTASTPRIVEVNADYYTFQFENGLYSVEIINGNSNIRDVEVKNQVSVGTNNTTGFIDPKFLELSLFDGGVAIHVTNGIELTPSGKAPSGGIIGTRQTPVNNMEDAITIANQRGLKTLYITSNIILDETCLCSGFILEGDSQTATIIEILPDADVTNCEFRNCHIEGTLDGGNYLRECSVGDIVYFNGIIHECGLSGTVTLGGMMQATLWECYSNVAGGEALQYPIINLNGSGNSLAIRNWYGGLGLVNYSGGSSVSIDISSGRIVLDNTLTSGTIFIRGIAEVQGNTGGTTINVDGLVASNSAINPWNAQLTDNNDPGTFGEFIQSLLTISKFLGLK
jgi:hypothetical protein